MTSSLDTIRTRTSVRAFSREPLDPETRRSLETLLRDHSVGPFGNTVRLELMDLGEADRREAKGLGTYGIIKGARLYILAAIDDAPLTREDLGFCVEQVILGATELGLGTCWVGGTFRRGRFAERMGLSERQILPIVVPVGLPASKRSWRERALRLMAGSDHRKPWEELFFEGDDRKPLTRESCGGYAPALDGLRLAPSASNKQPWRVVGQQDPLAFHLCLERNVGYDKLFGGIDLQSIDMGIAMCHFQLVAEELGLPGAWRQAKPSMALGDLEYVVSWFGEPEVP